MALCWHSLAVGLFAVIHAIHCDESCSHAHEGHGCGHEGHACGCPHSDRYDFDFDIPDELDPDDFLRRLSAFIGTLPREYSVAQIEDALERWWRCENRALRRAMEKVHAQVCERGDGVLVNRVSGKVIRARCKSWRECEYCAWVYGKNVERRIAQVRALRAFVVFTMPSELGDWLNKAHIAAQARAMRRLAERLFRKFKRRFSMVWTREHNTKGEGSGRLHLNVLWDADWVGQAWLSEAAAGSGFGSVVHISRVGRAGTQRETATRYATKCLRYASKDLSTQADWPKNTRRWGASKKAREQMSRPERNPDWYWSPIDPPRVPVGAEEVEHAKHCAADSERTIWLMPDNFLPQRGSRGTVEARDGPLLLPLPDWLTH